MGWPLIKGSGHLLKKSLIGNTFFVQDIPLVPCSVLTKLCHHLRSIPYIYIVDTSLGIKSVLTQHVVVNGGTGAFVISPSPRDGRVEYHHILCLLRFAPGL